MPEWCEDRRGQLLVHVLVVPRASRTRIVGEHDGRLRVQLAAPPVDGEANEALVQAVAGWLDVTKASVHLDNGQTSRRKSLRIEGISQGEILSRLGAYVQV